MVRLKGSEGGAQSLAALFQFHYGSIKREPELKPSVTTLQFQFHYGSIKSLKWIDSEEKELNFNSTMVRLKAFRLLQELSCSQSFQFHYGSIKRIFLLISG